MGQDAWAPHVIGLPHLEGLFRELCKQGKLDNLYQQQCTSHSRLIHEYLPIISFVDQLAFCQ
jgi:hypothetical protein